MDIRNGESLSEFVPAVLKALLFVSFIDYSNYLSHSIMIVNSYTYCETYAV